MRLNTIALEYSVGAYFVWLVWALKPHEPKIVCICSSEAKADSRLHHMARLYPGARMVKERVPLDHAFGSRDLQSVIYAAPRKGGE